MRSRGPGRIPGVAPSRDGHPRCVTRTGVILEGTRRERRGSWFRVYVATKAAVIKFSRSLTREMGGYRITVKAVTPTPQRPPVVGETSRERSWRTAQSPTIARDQRAAELVGAVFFLGSPDAAFVTGQVLRRGQR